MANSRNSLTGTVTIPKSVTTSDYNSLLNLPTINGKTIKGNLTLEDLGIDSVSEEDVKHIVSEAIKNTPPGSGDNYVTSEEVNDIINNNIASADDSEINEMLDEVMPVEQTAE